MSLPPNALPNNRPPARRRNAAAPVMLALATSTERCAIGLHLTSGELLVREAQPGEQGSGSVIGLVDQALIQAGLSRSAIDVIALDQGPGSFTGVRIGCAVGQGLAYALDRPVLMVGSLAAVASEAARRAAPALATAVWAAVDARMNEVYAERFDWQPDGQLQSSAPAEVLTAERLMLRLQEESGGPVLLAGNAFARFSVLSGIASRAPFSTRDDLWPEPAAIVNCALIRWRAGEAEAAADVEPLYVRNKVALEIGEQRRAR